MVSNSFQQKKQSQHGLPLRWLGLFGHRCHLGHWKCMLPSLVRCWGQDFCSWAKCDGRSLGRIWHVLQGKDGIEMVGGLLEQTWKNLHRILCFSDAFGRFYPRIVGSHRISSLQTTSWIRWHFDQRHPSLTWKSQKAWKQQCFKMLSPNHRQCVAPPQQKAWNLW